MKKLLTVFAVFASATTFAMPLRPLTLYFPKESDGRQLKTVVILESDTYTASPANEAVEDVLAPLDRNKMYKCQGKFSDFPINEASALKTSLIYQLKDCHEVPGN